MAAKGIMTRRIPTILGVLILLGGLVGGIILVNARQGLETQAGPTESPKNVKISNLGSNTFSINWTTDTPLTGLIRYSEDPAKITIPAGDVRDQISGTSQSYNNHTVNVSGLSPNRTYYFLIVSGSGTYNDNGKPFQVRTLSSAIAPPEDVIFGKVVRESGENVTGGILFVEAEGGMTLSTITQTDGTWRLNLANSRSSDGRVLTYDQASTLLSIFVQAGSAGTATALTNTSKAKPVPDIVLGRNQSFVDGTQVAVLEATGSATSTGFQLELSQLTLSEQLEATGSVKILNPATNGEIIATDLPEFRGKAPTGSQVRLSIDGPDQNQVVTADSNADWKWTPSFILEQGAHTLTAEYTDTNNQVQRILRTFTVLLTGQPAFVATPAGSPTMTPLPTLTPLPSPTEITVMPATESGTLEEAGALSTTIGFAILGIFLIGLGSLSKRWLK